MRSLFALVLGLKAVYQHLEMRRLAVTPILFFAACNAHAEVIELSCSIMPDRSNPVSISADTEKNAVQFHGLKTSDGHDVEITRNFIRFRVQGPDGSWGTYYVDRWKGSLTLFAGERALVTFPCWKANRAF